ncbi:MAG: hypothetical protein V4732_08115 [Pseudomonadota bacterium]
MIFTKLKKLAKFNAASALLNVNKYDEKQCHPRMKSLATLPTHVPALQQLVLEQQHMIETLKNNCDCLCGGNLGRVMYSLMSISWAPR